MEYKVDPKHFSSMFFLPTLVADKLIKLSGAVQLKVLLVALRNDANKIEPEKIADKLSISTPDVIDALNYWVESGVLLSDNEVALVPEIKEEKPKERTTVRREVIKPTREEIARRGEESQEITFMLREAQKNFGRTLTQNEAASLVWLHDDEGMNVEVILMLITFLMSEGKVTVGKIERTALNWVKNGVETVLDAENEINKIYGMRSAWNTVQKTLGIDKRKPSDKENRLSYKWINEFRFTAEIIREAYNICVDKTAKLSFDYINKVLEAWQSKGVKTLEDIRNLNDNAKQDKKQAKNSTATYDLDKYNDLLNNLPE